MRITGPERASLLSVLQKQKDALLKKAIENKGQVDPQELESVERLEKLRDLSSPPAHTLTIEILIASMVALCILTLLLLRMPQAHIELHIEATKVRFLLSSNTMLSDPLSVKWIAIQGQSQISAFPIGDGDHVTITDPLVVAKLADPNSSPMSLVLPELPAQSEVELSQWADGTREIAFCNLDRPVPLVIASPVQLKASSTLVLPSTQVHVLIFPSSPADPSLIHNSNTRCQQSPMLRFRFVPATNGDIEFGRELIVRDLELFEQDQPTGQPFSTLVSGQFRVSSTKANPTVLLPNDLLEMTSSSGRMRSLTMGEKTTKFDFQGTVRALSIGSAAMRRSAMPSMLEWWLSQDLIFVAWSAGLSSIAFLLGVYQWILKRR